MKNLYLLLIVALGAALFNLHYTLLNERQLWAQERAEYAQREVAAAGEQQTLMAQVEHFRTLSGRNGASVDALRLRTAELERLRAADAELIRSLRLSLRRTELITSSTVEGNIDFSSPLTDTLSPLPSPSDTLTIHPVGSDTAQTLAIDHSTASQGSSESQSARRFEWNDPWTQVTGLIVGDSVSCTLHTTDTIHQVIHRVPRRFLFLRFGTRALRQEIISSNPHNQIVYSEIIKVDS